MTVKEFINKYNCLVHIQANAGKIVGGGLIVGLPYKKAFQLSVCIKAMQPHIDAYQETINKIGFDMGLQPVNNGAFYTFPDKYPTEKKNEYVGKLDDLRKTEIEFENPSIIFTDSDLEGIELNIIGEHQQTFFEHFYKPSTAPA